MGQTNPGTVDRYIRKDTRWECAAHHIGSPGDGPTAFVLGGQHRNEPAGFRAASRIAGASVERGDVWVVPRMNKTGIEANIRAALPGSSDFNRSWNAGGTPTSNTAKAVWSLVKEVQPDVVMDLHTSRGFYKRSPSGFGQAIFPTSPAAETAKAACRWLNEHYVQPSLSTPKYDFILGNTQGTKGKGLFSHKVGYELKKPCYLIEIARPGIALDQRVELEYAAACYCLEKNGVVIE